MILMPGTIDTAGLFNSGISIYLFFLIQAPLTTENIAASKV